MIKLNKIKRVRHVTGIGERRNADRVWLESLKQRGRLGDLRVKWENNLKMDVKGIRWAGLDWICLA
jgi:hypothetical protein